MEGFVSSLVLDSAKSNQKGENACSGRCDFGWIPVRWKNLKFLKAIRFTLTVVLLQFLGSQPGLRNSSATVSDEVPAENDIEMATSSEGQKLIHFRAWEQKLKRFWKQHLVTFCPFTKNQKQVSENFPIKEINEFQSLTSVGNPFLPSYSNDMKDPETVELGMDASLSLYETEPSTNSIFRVWDMDNQ